MLKLLNKARNIFMARPKGSPNKPKTEKPAEFNYEEEADRAYANAMNPATQHVATPNQTNRAEFDYAEEEGAPAQQQVQPAYPMHDTSLNLYLISGRVRLERNGQAPVIADQQRLVFALNFNEAAMKYNSYFVSMSNAAERYSVDSMSGSEAIR
jgi:hypothetical protein